MKVRASVKKICMKCKVVHRRGVVRVICVLSLIHISRQNMAGQALVYHPGPRFIMMTMLTLTTGSAFIMWLGEQISDRGIGNGMSLIIFAGIVVGLPRAVGDLWDKAKTQQWGSFTPIALIGLIVLMLGVVALSLIHI